LADTGLFARANNGSEETSIKRMEEAPSGKRFFAQLLEGERYAGPRIASSAVICRRHTILQWLANSVLRVGTGIHRRGLRQTATFSLHQFVSVVVRNGVASGAHCYQVLL